jgi:hypothetical protein
MVTATAFAQGACWDGVLEDHPHPLLRNFPCSPPPTPSLARYSSAAGQGPLELEVSYELAERAMQVTFDPADAIDEEGRELRRVFRRFP